MAERRKRKAAAQLQPDVAVELRHPREVHSQWLWLANKELTEIPEELFDLTDLEIIDLSGNRLTTVPERLWDLPKLAETILVGNPLESLPDRPGVTIDGPIYRRLHDQIDAKNIRLVIGVDTLQEDEDFWAAALRTARGLRELTVGKWHITIGDDHPKPGQALERILESLFNLDSLEALSLRGMKLGAVPEGIRQLRGLKFLGLDALDLKDLPDWIGQLDLERFAAVDNKLCAVPESFRNLGRLKSLRLSWNPINQIPPLVFDLVTLEELQIRACALREIPADILRLHRLQFLVCENNPIESPPAEIANKGLDAIRDYWRQRADTGVDYLCEAKLIILARPARAKHPWRAKLKTRTINCASARSLLKASM